MTRFKSIGLDFNDTFKKLDTSTKKIRENREVKREKKFNEVSKKVEEKIKVKPYSIEIVGDTVLYLTKKEPTDIILKETSLHYLQFKDFKFPKSKDYVPWEKKNIQERRHSIYLSIMIYTIEI